MIKKAVALIFSTIFVFALCSCAGVSNTSGTVSITSVESELNKSHSTLRFNIKEQDDQVVFDYIDTFWKIEYSGTADKNQNVQSIKIVYSGVSADIVKNKSKMITIMNDSLPAQNVTFGETKVAMACSDLLDIYTILGAERKDIDSALEVFCDGKTEQINGWRISVKQIGTTLTISAEM